MGGDRTKLVGNNYAKLIGGKGAKLIGGDGAILTGGDYTTIIGKFCGGDCVKCWNLPIKNNEEGEEND